MVRKKLRNRSATDWSTKSPAGTVYSSLSYLLRFPVDSLKIDQSFVKTMDAENYAIVTTIVGLARDLDLKVVAHQVTKLGEKSADSGRAVE